MLITAKWQRNRKVIVKAPYQWDFTSSPLAASRAWATDSLLVLRELQEGMKWGGKDGDVRREKNKTWGEGGGDERGSLLQSCRLDILCFDGLPFIFTVVFLCCGGAVLKSSIFS